MRALFDTLSLLLRRPDRELARRLGVPPGVLAALRWMERPCAATRDGALRIGLAGRARGLPPSLRCPRTGADVPVEWVAGSAAATAQSWIQMENLDQPGGFGTLCAMLRNPLTPDKLYALTAGHVLAGNPRSRFKDATRLTQPFPPLTFDGTLWNYSPDLDMRGQDVPFDAALMQLDAADAEALVDELPFPTGWGNPMAAQQLFLLTRQHWLQARPVTIMTTMIHAGEPRQLYLLRDVLCYQVDAGTQGGDSGAPVWDERERLVAMHAGAAAPGALGNAIASPIQPVLEWATFDLVKRNEPLVAEGRGAVVGARATAAAAAPVPLAEQAGRDVDILARTMWGEARGEGPDGLRAVGQTVMNRVRARRWWGDTVEAVCLKPMQYSCWNSGDPNRAQALAATPADAVFALALRCAQELIAMAPDERIRTDDTNGATHYFAESLVPIPSWARGHTACAHIGHHLFYRGIA